MENRPHTLSLECSSLCNPNGTGMRTFVLQFAEALLAECDRTGEFAPELLYRISRWKNRAHRFRPDNAAIRWHAYPLLPPMLGADILHSLSGRFVQGARNKQIVSIFDFAVMQKTNPLSPYASEHVQERFRQHTQEIAESADAVVTLAPSAKTDFLELFDYDEDRVSVIAPGLHPRYLTYEPSDEAIETTLRKHGLERGRYFLFVGTVSLRKNTPNLIQAFAHTSFPGEYALALAGPLYEVPENPLQEVPQLGLEESVKLLGYVDDADLPNLYAGAKAFLFPTFYEGFGFPILESMACGTAVLTGNRGAAPEVADGKAVLCDPHDVDSIQMGIEQAAEMSHAQIHEARQHARTFTWERAAKQTHALYRDVIAKGGRKQ